MTAAGRRRLRGSPLWLVLLLLLATLTAAALASFVPSRIARFDWLLLLAALGFAGLVIAARAHFGALVLFDFCLLGLVRNEPAPVDGLSVALLVVGVGIGHLSLRSLAGSTLLHGLVWTFVLANLVSLALNPSNNAYSQRYVLITLYLIGFAYFVRLYLTSVRAARLIVLGYAISVGISIVLVGLGHLGIGADLFIVDNRARAFFKDPNVLGPSAVLLVLLLLDGLWHPQAALIRVPRLLALLGMVLAIALVMLSFSRAAVGNLLIAVATYVVLNLRGVSAQRFASLLATALIAGAATVLLTRALGLEDFLWSRAGWQSYDEDRFAGHEAGVELALSHLFGIGPGMMSGGHSLYVRSIAEYGIPSALSLFAVIVLPLVSVFRAAIGEDQKPLGFSAKVVAAAFTGLLVNSIVIDTLHWRQFWLVWALAWAVGSAAHSREAPPRDSPRP